MTLPRCRAVSFLLRAVLLVAFFVTAVPAFSFAASAAQDEGPDFPSASMDDDLGLGIGPVHSNDEALFTFFYNATSYGEMQPCPT